MLDAGAPTNIDPGANATGAIAVNAPSTTSLLPCCTKARGRWCTGYSPPFCCALPVRPDALRGRWGSISAPVIGGAGGCAMLRCPMKWSGNWKGVEADELYHTAGQKGQAKQGGKKALGRRARGRRKKREPGRGHYDKDRPAIIAWVSRQGAVVLQATKDFTVKTVQKAADIAVRTGSRLYTDSASSYRALRGYYQEYVNQTKKEYARGDVHEKRAECLFSLLKPSLRVLRGITKRNLPGYVGFFQFLRNVRHLNTCEQAELILQAALEPAIASRARRGAFVTCFDHVDLLQTARN